MKDESNKNIKLDNIIKAITGKKNYTVTVDEFGLFTARNMVVMEKFMPDDVDDDVRELFITMLADFSARIMADIILENNRKGESEEN